MKKRWAMGLLCCLLLFQLAFPAKAAGSVYFVAAEESVLPVTDATMPFWANGYLYVPASVFTNLGISVINNTAKKMTVLEKDRRAMLFDWAKGTAQDSSGSLFTPGVIQSGGLVFVPASTVANFFGLQYSVTDVTNGYLVWLRSPDFLGRAPRILPMRRPTIWKSATTRITGCHVQYHAQCTGYTLRTDAGGPESICVWKRISGPPGCWTPWTVLTAGPPSTVRRTSWSPTANCCGGWLPPVMRWAYWRRAARTRRSSCGGAMKPVPGHSGKDPAGLRAGCGGGGAAGLGGGRLAVPDTLDGPGGL